MVKIETSERNKYEIAAFNQIRKKIIWWEAII
jgi:hypothetical protein